jgi:hypothetical protein
MDFSDNINSNSIDNIITYYEEKINSINETFLTSLNIFKKYYILYYRNIDSIDETYKNNYESLNFFIKQKINEMEMIEYDIKNDIVKEINNFNEINTKLQKEKNVYTMNKNKLDKIKNEFQKSKESINDSKDIYKSGYVIYTELLIGFLMVVYLQYKLFS